MSNTSISAEKPHVLVTGGAGYFGSLLVHRLLAEGYRVRVLDISSEHDLPTEVEFLQADIRDFEAVRKACQGVQIVHHNVAQVPLAKNPRLFREVNIDGTANLLRASSEAGVQKLIAMSSSAVFGVPKNNPVTESTLPTPGEEYGRAKFEAEQLCQRWVKEKGLDVTIIRPRTILGHGRLGIFQILFEWIRRGSNIPVFDGGKNLYQFVHASDLAEACILASRRSGATIYNCGAERFGTMREGLEALCRHARTGSRVVSLPSAPMKLLMSITSAIGVSPLGAYHALMYGESLYFDISKARKELGWQPKFSNEEMLIESYEWYLSHREKILARKGASHHRSALKPGILWLVEKFLRLL